jgi:hypothetical protein
LPGNPKHQYSVFDPENLEHVLGANWWQEQLITCRRNDGKVEIDRRLPIRISFDVKKLVFQISMLWVIKNEAGVIQG